jgi:DNA (cytosine-5)-methyltransferase 1
MRKPTVASFFSGCGGLDLGFHKSHYDVVLANDFWEQAMKTYRHNFKDVMTTSQDINQIDKEKLQSLFSKTGYTTNDIDVVIGGPPCQGFSRLNNRNIHVDKIEKDERNSLFEEFLRVSSILEPEIILMENVKDLITRKTSEGNYVKDNIIDAFNEYGYNCRYEVLNAVDYEVPQKRKRIFFIGSKNTNVYFPEKSNKKVTAGEALHNIDGSLPNMTYRDSSQKVIEKIKNIPQGGYYKHLPREYKSKTYKCDCEDKEKCEHEPEVSRRFGSYLRKVDPDEPALTVSTNEFLHPTENRYMTPREMARLQTFPDWFKIKGSKRDVMKQIGNAVPPRLSKKLADCILNYFNGEWEEKPSSVFDY